MEPDEEILPLDTLPGSSELWDIAEALYDNDRLHNPQFGPWSMLLRRANDDVDPRKDPGFLGPDHAAAALRTVGGYLDEARAAMRAIYTMTVDMKLAAIERVKGATGMDEETLAAEVWHGAICVILTD